MREINLIVIHCSATREDRCFTEHDLEECHRRRGFEGGPDCNGRSKDTRTEWQKHLMRVLVEVHRVSRSFNVFHHRLHRLSQIYLFLNLC
jgi:hypothetical protein